MCVLTCVSVNDCNNFVICLIIKEQQTYLCIKKADYTLILIPCHCFSFQNSSICKAAIHAGVIGADGGFVDVLPLDKRKNYVGVLKNGIQSERYYSFSVANYFFLLQLSFQD